MFKNVFRVNIKGLNLDRLINFIMQNYNAYNLNRIGHEELEVDLSYKFYYNLLSKIDTSCYNITIVKTFGYYKLLANLKRNLALVITLIFCFGCFTYLNTRLLKITINGAEPDTIKEIYNVLNQKNIKTFKSNKIKLNNLEQDLLEQVNNISLVSAVIKGNVLIINVKEKLPDIVQDYADLVAPFNLIIDSVECYQGTLLKNAGDVVKRGEVIIGAYYINQEQKEIAIKPVYKLKATTYFSGEAEFKKSETKFVRTGKKIVNSCYNMFGKDFLKNNKVNKFQYFEEEYTCNQLFNNLFIPLTIKKHTIYELKEVTIEHNFEEEKDTYLKQSLDNASSLIPKNLVAKNTTQNILDMPDGKKIVQTFIEVELELTND